MSDWDDELVDADLAPSRCCGAAGIRGGWRRRREIVDAFLIAAREGDFAGLLAELDPDVVRRSDRGWGVLDVSRGAEKSAAQARRFAYDMDLDSCCALVNGAPGIVTSPTGQPFSVLAFEIADDPIVAIGILVDLEQLAALDLPAVCLTAVTWRPHQSPRWANLKQRPGPADDRCRSTSAVTLTESRPDCGR